MDVLDDLLDLFRRRRSPRRRRRAAADSKWRINLATLGGMIGLERPDRIPRAGPPMRPRRAYQETDDWQPAPSYAPQPGPYAPPQPYDESADWQAAQSYTQHAEPRTPQRARLGDGRQVQPPPEQPVEQRNYLAAHAVEKSFGDRKVVKGASLYVRRGEAVGLLGPNGAGKTTIFYMITGLIAADRGRVELDGHDVTTLPMYQRARLGIGYLPQEASIFRGLTVEENIRAVLEVVEKSKKRRERDLDALLDEFNIAKLRDRPRAGDAAELHAARRAVRRHRSDRGRRHSGPGSPPDQPRHRRADHRPQRSRDARPHRPRLYHLLRRGADGGPHRRHREQPRGAAALSGRGIQALKPAPDRESGGSIVLNCEQNRSSGPNRRKRVI
jgi:lipopolysaccharide export system ATP-binding protein